MTLCRNEIRTHDEFLINLIMQIDFHGLDGYGGILYIGSGCFHRREVLSGRHYSKHWKKNTKIDKPIERDTNLETLEAKCKSLTTCSFEDNTGWGNEVSIYTLLSQYRSIYTSTRQTNIHTFVSKIFQIGLKYGCPVEDIITGLSIKCRGWKSIYFNPPRTNFVGLAPMTLSQTLVQHKRWSEGDFQIFLSKYNPFLFGHGKIKFGLQMCYSVYLLWAPCSLPTLYYSTIPSLALLNSIPLFPDVSHHIIIFYICYQSYCFLYS